jgi:hypothetical protein
MPQTPTFDSPSTIHEHGDLRVREHFDRLCQGFNNNFPMCEPDFPDLGAATLCRPGYGSPRGGWFAKMMEVAIGLSVTSNNQGCYVTIIAFCKIRCTSCPTNMGAPVPRRTERQDNNNALRNSAV